MPPVVIAAGIAAVGVVGSAVISSKAAGKAADVQATAAERTAQLQESQFAQTREDLAPWRETGAQALGQYAGLLGVGDEAPDTAAMQTALEQYPGYQFALSQGAEAVSKFAGSQGLLQSGQNLKSLTEYGQGIGASNFENYMNRLQGLAGTGQQAVVQTGQFGAQAVQQQGLAGERAGAARATGYIQQADILGGALEGLANIGGYLTKQPIWGGGSTPAGGS